MGFTPLDYAGRFKHDEVILFLIKELWPLIRDAIKNKRKIKTDISIKDPKFSIFES